MKLTTYRHRGEDRLGAISQDSVIDLNRAHRARCSTTALADAEVPTQIVQCLQGGARALDLAGQALATVEGGIGNRDQ